MGGSVSTHPSSHCLCSSFEPSASLTLRPLFRLPKASAQGGNTQSRNLEPHRRDRIASGANGRVYADARTMLVKYGHKKRRGKGSQEGVTMATRRPRVEAPMLRHGVRRRKEGSEQLRAHGQDEDSFQEMERRPSVIVCSERRRRRSITSPASLSYPARPLVMAQVIPRAPVPNPPGERSFELEA